MNKAAIVRIYIKSIENLSLRIILTWRRFKPLGPRGNDVTMVRSDDFEYTHDSVSFLDVNFSSVSDLHMDFLYLVASTKKTGNSASLIYSISLGSTCS